MHLGVANTHVPAVYRMVPRMLLRCTSRHGYPCGVHDPLDLVHRKRLCDVFVHRKLGRASKPVHRKATCDSEYTARTVVAMAGHVAHGLPQCCAYTIGVDRRISPYASINASVTNLVYAEILDGALGCIMHTSAGGSQR